MMMALLFIRLLLSQQVTNKTFLTPLGVIDAAFDFEKLTYNFLSF